MKQLRIAEKVAQLNANRIGDTILEYLIQPLRSDLPDLLPNIPTSEGVVIAETRRQAGRLPTRPVLHLPSEQVFYRVPIITPYDSPIFICVQSGNIAGMRELWRLGLASIDAVDPYGLGLLYVRSPPPEFKVGAKCLLCLVLCVLLLAKLRYRTCHGNM